MKNKKITEMEIERTARRSKKSRKRKRGKTASTVVHRECWDTEAEFGTTKRRRNGKSSTKGLYK
jgi:hypothetical protein